MTPGEQLHQQRLAELAQNIRWRNQAILLFVSVTVIEVLLYPTSWNLLWLVLVFPWYWLLRQCLHYQQEAVLDWQFIHLMHPRFRDVDSVFHIPVPLSLKTLEFPEGFWADRKPTRKKSRKTR
jgi:hypothetical protein